MLMFYFLYYTPMNRMELIKVAASAAGITQDASKKAFDAIFNAMKLDVSNGNTIVIFGFGTFSAKKRKERTVLNFKTNQRDIAPEHMYPHFKPSIEFKAKTRNK